MKWLLSILLGLHCSFILAQEQKEVVLYGEKITIPADCEMTDTYVNYDGKDVRNGIQIKRGKEFIQCWNYDFIPEPAKEPYEKQMQHEMFSFCEESDGKCIKKEQRFTFFDHGLNGYLLTLTDKKKANKCFFIITGKINNEYIMIYAGMARNPKKNRDIPEFIRRVVRLE